MARRIAVFVLVAAVELDDEIDLPPRPALLPGPRACRPAIVVPPPSRAPDVDQITTRAVELVEQAERGERDTVRPGRRAAA